MWMVQIRVPVIASEVGFQNEEYKVLTLYGQYSSRSGIHNDSLLCVEKKNLNSLSRHSEPDKRIPKSWIVR